eukprot:4203404-Alexandrium_andersonii.AAC.1
MSASLVGSEMCIRDSPWFAPAGATRCGGGALAGGIGLSVIGGRCPACPRSPPRDTPPARCAGGAFAGGGGGAAGCLLYTSDAADDM